MSYTDKKIKEIVEMIGENKIYLPAIQRKFVWKYNQIENLFDSIMRGYPIGTFLFWFVNGNKKNEYTFYKFLLDFHERDKFLNDKAPHPELKDEIIGVLDGQQRLSSLYIALQGTYAYKKPYYHWNNDDAFPQRKLYLNLIKNKNIDEDKEYEFKFLTEEESKMFSEKNIWFPIRNVLTWDKMSCSNDYFDNNISNKIQDENLREFIQQKRNEITNIMSDLWQRLVNDKLISYFEVREPELDNILDIFVRVNSAGTVLSKSDLLFSTIVANWENGRSEFENFLTSINKKGEGFNFNNDFLMRCCLVLSDCPVLFKVNNFKEKNINLIKEMWLEKIKPSIEKTIKLLVKFGFSSETLTSHNAIIPIAYYFLKGGNDSEESIKNIRKYLIHSLIKQIYGGQGDQVLSKIRQNLTTEKKDEKGQVTERNLLNKEFIFNDFLTFELPTDRKLEISNEDIEEILEYKKSSYTFMILTLLYPNLKFEQIKFHQDHIHPASLFTEAKFKKYGIDLDLLEEQKILKDKLPNLQLLEERENESKNKTPFNEWFEQNIPDKAKFLQDNFIPQDTNLDITNFTDFFEKRKNILRNKIKEVLQ